jgi:hypothetical protein
MKGRPRTTLLEHPATIHGDRFRIDPRPPEKILNFANSWLVRRNIKTKKAMQDAMSRDANDDPIARDASWLRGHCVSGLEMISKLPESQRAEARKLWAYAFHAGARHESMTVNLKYLHDVQSADNRRSGRANRKPLPSKITREKYMEMSAKTQSSKKLSGLLNASRPTVRAFEKKNPELIVRKK